MVDPVSLRQAAAALAVPKSTLSQLIRRETTLAAAVVGHGPRGSLQIDLAQLSSAWARLQAPGDEDGRSDRARYDLERRRRLWWECCALEQQVADLENALIDAEEAAEALAAAEAEVREAAAAWAAAVAPEVAGLDQATARVHLQASIVAQLQQLAAPADTPSPARPPLPTIAVPSPLPGLWQLRAEIERGRGRLAQLQLQQDRGELEPAAVAIDRFSCSARRLRDAWQRVGEQLALQTRRLATGESVRTAALQALSAAGLG